MLKHLSEDTLVIDEDDTHRTGRRMARVADIALIEKPADHRLLKRIECYQVVEHSAVGAAFRLDPARLVYPPRWQHKFEPTDFDLVLLQDGLLAPQAIDWTRLSTAGVIQRHESCGASSV